MQVEPRLFHIMDGCCHTEEKRQIDRRREGKRAKDRGRDSMRSVRLMAEGVLETESSSPPSCRGTENPEEIKGRTD